MKNLFLAFVMFVACLSPMSSQVVPRRPGGGLKTFEFSYVRSTRKENQKFFGKSYNSVSEKIEKRLLHELRQTGLTQVENLDGPCCRIRLDLRNVTYREAQSFGEEIGCESKRQCAIVEMAATITVTDWHATNIYQRVYAGTSLGVFDPGQMLDPFSFLKVRDLACRSLVERMVEDAGLLTALQTGARPLLPGSGSVAENTYSNHFFRFAYRFPAGWQVRSQEAQKSMMERGQEIIYGTLPKGSYSEAEQEHGEALKLASFLFAADERPPESATGSSIQIVAFDLATDLSFKTAEDQLGSRLASARLSRRAKLSVDGHQFATAQYEIPNADNNGKSANKYQAAALTLDRNYSIVWLFFSDSQSGLEELLGGLENISFKQTPHD